MLFRSLDIWRYWWEITKMIPTSLLFLTCNFAYHGFRCKPLHQDPNGEDYMSLVQHLLQQVLSLQDHSLTNA